MRVFESGATRDSDEGKIDYAGCLSPYAQRAFGEYMLAHQVQPDGSRRDSRNWQKGIPMPAYISSAARHWHEVWEAYERHGAPSVEALCALMFNVQGMLHELTKPKDTAYRTARCASQTFDGRWCRFSAGHPGDCAPEPMLPDPVTIPHTGTSVAPAHLLACLAKGKDGRHCWKDVNHAGKHSWESF